MDINEIANIIKNEGGRLYLVGGAVRDRLLGKRVHDEDYCYKDALLVLKEMVDLISLELVDKGLCTNVIHIGVGYSKDIIKRTSVSIKLLEYTNSRKKLIEYFVELFEKNVNREYMIG